MADPGRTWRAFRALSWRDRGLLARAWLLLSVASPGLRLFGFGRTQAVLGAGASSASGRIDAAEARHVARIVHAAASRNPTRPNCLARSLVLCRLLRLRGLGAELRIGVAKPGGDLAAHAWVEHDGVALGEPEPEGRLFAALDAASTGGGA